MADDPDSRLPKASTCFLQLHLPAYSNETTLRRRVLVAVRYGAQGFEFS